MQHPVTLSEREAALAHETRSELREIVVIMDSGRIELARQKLIALASNQAWDGIELATLCIVNRAKPLPAPTEDE